MNFAFDIISSQDDLARENNNPKWVNNFLIKIYFSLVQKILKIAEYFCKESDLPKFLVRIAIPEYLAR
jgi:hypothetical protein